MEKDINSMLIALQFGSVTNRLICRPRQHFGLRFGTIERRGSIGRLAIGSSNCTKQDLFSCSPFSTFSVAGGGGRGRGRGSYFPNPAKDLNRHIGRRQSRVTSNSERASSETASHSQPLLNRENAAKAAIEILYREWRWWQDRRWWKRSRGFRGRGKAGRGRDGGSDVEDDAFSGFHLGDNADRENWLRDLGQKRWLSWLKHSKK